MNLITSKIRLPRWRRDLLSRPRLIEYVQQHLTRKLIVVVAPPGYGKTTLLLDIAYHASLPVCWYSLDEHDADSRVFLEYLILSIRQRFPDFGARSLAALADFRPVREEEARLIGVFVNEFYDTVTQDCILALDGFEAADTSESISRLLEALLRYLPDQLHIILASRTFPQRSAVTLPLIANGDVAGISGQQLRFQPDEVMALAADIYQHPLGPTTAQDIAMRSEGWIMGIQLTSRLFGLGQVEGAVPPSANQDLLFDYLADQVFKPLAPEHQDFLLRTSILNPLAVDLVNAALARDDAQAVFHQLLDALPMFVIPQGDEATYRYHALFQSFLQRMLARDPALERAAHAAAARTQAQRAERVEAVLHYVAAHEMAAAGALASQVVDDLYRTGRWETLRHLVARLPRAARTSELLVAEALRLKEQGQFDAALMLLSEVEATGEPRWQALAQMRRSSIWCLQGRYHAALSLMRDVLAGLNDADDMLLGEAHRHMGRAHHGLRQLAPAIDHFQIALACFERAQSIYNVAHVQHELGYAYAALGQREPALAAYQAALSTWDTVHARGWRLNTLNNVAAIYYDQGRLADARRLLEEIVADAEAAGYATVEASARIGLGIVQRDLGLLDEALATLRSGLELAQPMAVAYLIVYALDAIGNTLRLQGAAEQAVEQLLAGLSLAQQQGLPYETALCTASLGILALERGAEDLAQRQLETARTAFTEQGAQSDLAAVEFALARLAFSRQDKETARCHLERAASIARQLGAYHFLVAAAGRATPLLRWAIAQRLDSDFWSEVYAQIRLLPFTPPEARTPPVDIVAFGKSHIYVRGKEAVPDWTTLRELFFFLLLHQPRGVHREALMETFWPDTPSTQAGQSLKVALHRLRKSICETHYDAGWYSLVLPDGWRYDVGLFTSLTDRVSNARAMTPEQAAQLQHAVKLYQGDYLAEYYSDWVMTERERLKQVYLRTLFTLGDYFAQQGDHEQAIEFYQTIVATDEYQEPAHQALMRCYMALGQRPQAIQHFREMVQVLKRDLGIDPTPETQRLFRQIVESAG